MKNIVLAMLLTLISGITLAAEARSIALASDWAFISCRQMENGGVTIQRRNLDENAVVSVIAPDYQTPVYEVYVDGKLEASCRFLTVRK